MISLSSWSTMLYHLSNVKLDIVCIMPQDLYPCCKIPLTRIVIASVAMWIKSGILQQEHLMFCGSQQASKEAKGKGGWRKRKTVQYSKQEGGWETKKCCDTPI